MPQISHNLRFNLTTHHFAITKSTKSSNPSPYLSRWIAVNKGLGQGNATSNWAGTSPSWCAEAAWRLEGVSQCYAFGIASAAWVGWGCRRGFRYIGCWFERQFGVRPIHIFWLWARSYLKAQGQANWGFLVDIFQSPFDLSKTSVHLLQNRAIHCGWVQTHVSSVPGVLSACPRCDYRPSCLHQSFKQSSETNSLAAVCRTSSLWNTTISYSQWSPLGGITRYGWSLRPACQHGASLASKTVHSMA